MANVKNAVKPYKQEAFMPGKHLIYLLMYFFVCAVFIVFTVVPVANSKPFRLKKIPQGGVAFGCLVCHVNSKGRLPLNPFGKDYERIAIPAGDIYTKELGELDSDGDGFTNDTEFEAHTNPGNPNSKPQSN
jgi:hypothetical protein